METIGPSGSDSYSFYGPNGTVLATFTLSLAPGVTWYSYFGSAWVYFGGTLLGTTGGSAGSEYSSIVDRLGTGHPGYAYGTDIGSKTGSGVFDFATYMKDSTTGLDYANQRWYSAGMGRFLSVDPYGGSASSEDPGSWNRYTYGANDPINGSDPSGLLMSSDPGLTPFGPGFGGPGGSGCITSPWATGISFDLDSPAFDPYTMLAYGSGCSQFGMLLPNLAMMPNQGGGGGARSNQTLRVGNYSTTSNMALGVQNSLRTLESALQQDPDCSNWLTGNQSIINTLVGDTNSGTIYAGVGSFSEINGSIINAVAGSPGASNLPPGALLTVNTSGAFFNSGVKTGYQNDINGNTDLAKAFILLHELGHLTGAAGFQENDSPSSAAGNANQNSNNLMIEQKCSKTLDFFGGHF